MLSELDIEVGFVYFALMYFNWIYNNLASSKKGNQDVGHSCCRNQHKTYRGIDHHTTYSSVNLEASIYLIAGKQTEFCQFILHGEDRIETNTTPRPVRSFSRPQYCHVNTGMPEIGFQPQYD